MGWKGRLGERIEACSTSSWQPARQRWYRRDELLSDLSGVESSPAATILYLPRTRRGSCDPDECVADGCTPRHLLCATVHSAGSRLPLEGTERYEMAQMTKIKIV